MELQYQAQPRDRGGAVSRREENPLSDHKLPNILLFCTKKKSCNVSSHLPGNTSVDSIHVPLTSCPRCSDGVNNKLDSILMIKVKKLEFYCTLYIFLGPAV